MSRNNKIDQFFKHHLDSAVASMDGWDIPPDELWLNAKKEINQPIKKKRRAVVFWFFGMAAGLFLLISSYWFSDQLTRISYEKEVVNEHIIQDIAPVELETGSKLSPSTPLQKEDEEETIVEKTIVPIVYADSDPSLSSQKSTKTEQQSRAIVNNDKEQGKRWSHSEANVFLEVNDFNGTQKEVLFLENFNKEDTLISPVKVIPLLPIQSITDVFSIAKADELPEEGKQKAIIEKKNISWKSEIGFSHSRYLTNPFTVIEGQDIENNKFIDLLSSTYTSANIVINQKMQGRLSLSTGFYFTQQKIDVAFGFDSLVYVANNRIVEKGIERLTSSVINNNENELEFQFFSTANVLEGDTLELYGHLPVKLVAYQVPVGLNIHYGKRRLESLLNIGLTVDFIEITVDELPLEVFKNGVLVGDDINFKAFKKELLTATFYVGGGFKYHFNQHINASALFKVQPYNPTFSRYELGLNYRF